MNFATFKHAVAKQFDMMAKHDLFTTKVEKDDMWATYLGSFPEGSNPIYKTNTEHDCTCCKQFIRIVGNVVAIIDGKLVSIWDVDAGDPNYQAVADALSRLVKSHPIDNVFLHSERTAGTDKNMQDTPDGIKTWNHFFVNIPARFVNRDPGPALSQSRDTHNVLKRSMVEITSDAVETVLELIAQGSLYRGEEHKFAVEAFEALGRTYTGDLDLFVWSKVSSLPQSVSRIRNTAIGTLLVDLSEGVELDKAVASFEFKVAPQNYKRPTALVTKSMIESAKKTISDMGLTSALERRYATINDITINNILFANRGARQAIEGSVFDTLIAKAEKPKNLDKVEDVSIEDFLANILPTTTSLEVMMENRHTGNLVSLIAPVDPTALPMFKWGNKFSWSYNGEMADSDLRQAVQARGGRVDGVFRFSHSWNHEKRNASLMDLHVFMPGCGMNTENGVNDAYGNMERVGWNRRSHPKSGGVQDVDYTNPAPAGYTPVENITFPNLSTMPDGVYVCKIHNWQYRNPTVGGFRAEIEFAGQLFQYEYDKPLKNKEWVTVAEVVLNAGKFSIKHHLPVGSTPKQVWGIKTNTFEKVDVVMLSPNYWDGQGVGNKHYFFMLESCLNEGKARGFFNEFLRSDLDEHRKVIEHVGVKMRTEKAGDQLSGLGFSSTQRNELLCRVKGSFTRIIKILF